MNEEGKSGSNKKKELKKIITQLRKYRILEKSNLLLMVFLSFLIFIMRSPLEDILALFLFALMVIHPSFFIKRQSSIKKIRKKYPKLSVVGIIKQHKERDIFRAIYLLLSTIILYVGVSLILSSFDKTLYLLPISTTFLIILFGFIVCLFLYLLVFNFRVSQGWYGRSEFEAREIINFCINNSNNIDISNGGKSKPLFKPEDIRKISLQLGIPVPRTRSIFSENDGIKEG